MDMMNKILELVVFSQDLLVTQYEKPGNPYNHTAGAIIRLLNK
jgi:hypothetical protein